MVDDERKVGGKSLETRGPATAKLRDPHVIVLVLGTIRSPPAVERRQRRGSAGSNRNTHFCQTDKMELPRVDSCRRWYTAFTLFADEQRQVWITQFNQKITPCLPLPRIPLLKGRLLLSYGRLKCSIVICKNKRHHQMAPSL